MERIMISGIKENPLVSIIMPMYNAETKVLETIDSVKNQTYSNWELIIVDDCSKDSSYDLVNNICNKEPRIHLFKLDRNQGPGYATKVGVEKASGSLIAFIDSDDLWPSNKLDKQLRFMHDNNYDFTCTDYEQIDENGKPLHRVIKARVKANYKNILHTNPIGSSTVIISTELLKKIDIPEIRKDNDYALWLQILKVTDYVYGMNEVLMKYRVWSQSISHNRFKSVKYHWYVFRQYEGFGIVKSVFLEGLWAAVKILRIK